jgi:hypothetical protein
VTSAYCGAHDDQDDKAGQVGRHDGMGLGAVWFRGIRRGCRGSLGQGVLMSVMKRMAASISDGVQSSQLPFGGIASMP